MAIGKYSYVRLLVVLVFLNPVFIHTTYATEYIDASWGLSQAEIANIEQGKMVVHKQSQGYQKEIHAFLLIQTPPRTLLDVITDFPSLPEFMPHLEAIKVLHQDKQGALVDYMLALPFGVHKRYRLQLTYDTTPPDLVMAWHKVVWEGVSPDETIQDSTGFWYFKKADKASTVLHYYTKTDPGHVPFGLGWIVDYLTEKTVVDLLTQTQQRAETRWQKRQH